MEVTEAAAATEATEPASQPLQYDIPPGVLVELGADNHQLTDVQGAMVLAGKSRRTIQQWMANGWVEVRRTPAGRPRIVVGTLFTGVQS